MKLALIVAVLPLLAGEAAMAQGVNQSPSSTVIQQRQNGSTANSNTTTQTSRQSTGFSSPFTSPFGPSGGSSLPAKGGYAGSGANR